MNSTNEIITTSELPDTFAYDPIRLFIFITYFTIGGLITLIGNGLVVFLTAIHAQFHEPYMYIRAAFSILDLAGLLIQMPFIMLHMFGHQNPERVWCLFSSVSSGLWLSTVHLTAYLALERYFYFCRPLIYIRIFYDKNYDFRHKCKCYCDTDLYAIDGIHLWEGIAGCSIFVPAKWI